MNTIVLLGRTTSTIELKQTQAGKSVVSFSLAVKRPFTKDTTDFVTVVAWDKLAETMSKYVGKGNQICIRGHLQNRSWEDGNGNKRTATEVVAQDFSFCESKNNSEGNNAPFKQKGAQSEFEASPYVPDAYKTIAGDDDLPF